MKALSVKLQNKQQLIEYLNGLFAVIINQFTVNNIVTVIYYVPIKQPSESQKTASSVASTETTLIDIKEWEYRTKPNGDWFESEEEYMEFKKAQEKKEDRKRKNNVKKSFNNDVNFAMGLFLAYFKENASIDVFDLRFAINTGRVDVWELKELVRANTVYDMYYTLSWSKSGCSESYKVYLEWIPNPLKKELEQIKKLYEERIAQKKYH